MIACYDLDVAPETYNIVGFISLALAHAKQSSLELTSFVIIPGFGEDGFRSDDTEYYVEEQRWRLRELLVPLINTLLPQCELHIFKSRVAASRYLEGTAGRQLFPKNYSTDNPKSLFSVKSLVSQYQKYSYLPRFKSDSYAREIVKRRFEQFFSIELGKTISITLRCTHSFSPRNGSLDDWRGFARILQDKGYNIIVIPDTETAAETASGWGEALYFSEAALNIAIRQATYEQCSLNLFVNNGPAILCYASHFEYITFGLSKGDTVVSSLGYFVKEGFYPGSNWPGHTDRQLMVWELDSKQVILCAFEEWERLCSGIRTSMPEWARQIDDAISEKQLNWAMALSGVALAFNSEIDEAYALRMRALLASGRFLEALLTLPLAKKCGCTLEHVINHLGDTPESHEVIEMLRGAAAIIPENIDFLLESSRSYGFLVQVHLSSHEFLPNAEVIIYGTGSFGRNAFAAVRSRVNVVGFADSSSSRWGDEILGNPVLSPQDAVGLDTALIVVASTYWTEILEKLLSLKVRINRLIVSAEIPHDV